MNITNAKNIITNTCDVTLITPNDTEQQQQQQQQHTVKLTPSRSKKSIKKSKEPPKESKESKESKKPKEPKEQIPVVAPEEEEEEEKEKEEEKSIPSPKTYEEIQEMYGCVCHEINNPDSTSMKRNDICIPCKLHFLYNNTPEMLVQYINNPPAPKNESDADADDADESLTEPERKFQILKKLCYTMVNQNAEKYIELIKSKNDVMNLVEMVEMMVKRMYKMDQLHKLKHIDNMDAEEKKEIADMLNKKLETCNLWINQNPITIVQDININLRINVCTEENEVLRDESIRDLSGRIREITNLLNSDAFKNCNSGKNITFNIV